MEGYWTDSSSMDALSTCSSSDCLDERERTLVFSPSSSTPAPPVPPHTAYVVPSQEGSPFSKEVVTRALGKLGLNAVFLDSDGEEALPPCLEGVILIFQDFVGSLFENLRRRKVRIYGIPLILKVAETGGGLPQPRNGYPVYSRVLRNCKICATGIKTKEELVEIRRKILYLEGTFLEREGPMTHLVAGRCRGNKYRDAVALDKPILKPEWINYLWSHRNKLDLNAKQDLDMFKMKAFYGARIALEGFEAAERAGMVKLIEENEGVNVEAADPETTHIVKSSNCLIGVVTPAEENEDGSLTNAAQSPMKRGRFEPQVVSEADSESVADTGARVLRAEWFWTSIQIEACADENQYLVNPKMGGPDLDTTLNNSFGTPTFTSPFSDADGTPQQCGRRKRKRLMREFVSSLAQVEQPKSIMEVDEEEEGVDANLVKSPEQSQQNVEDSELAVLIKRIEKAIQSPDLKSKMESCSGKAFKRLNEFAHLVETEKNYVSILMHIVKLFKEPCEADDQKAGRILSSVEVKQIFGPILPIYELHKRVLRDMLHLLENYTDDSLIGQIYVKNAEELRKCYEPFVGYFETVKNEILRCENENPRFMAFLRIAQAKPQCGKEKLVELIIRPVQRLPSTALVLKNLEKNTEKSNPDFEWITKGVEAIDRVNQTINQKKERADARVAIFDVYHDIDGCPVELISDHRTLLKRYDVIALHYDTNTPNAPSYKNELFTLIVFSDHFQVTKRRSHLANTRNAGTLSMANLRSPAVSRKSMKFTAGSGAGGGAQKKYKFLEWVNFCHVKKIVNVNSSDNDPRSFAFIVREPEDLRERVLQFTLPEDWEMERIQKLGVVDFFAKQVAQSVARVDYENFITTVDAAALYGTSNSSGGFITRGFKKVGRALSLSRTPSKLKRTMSQIISSPFVSRSAKEKDPDTLSQCGNSENSFTTPIRNHLSTISLFGTKRGIGPDGQVTPKNRKTFFDKDPKPPKMFPAIEES